MRRLIVFAAAAGVTVSWGARPTSWTAVGNHTPRALDGGGLSEAAQDFYFDGEAAWVATTEGLGVTRDRGKTWRYYHKEDGLPHNDVVAVAVKDGDIWASCIEPVYVAELGGYVLYGRGLAHYVAAAGRWEVYGKAQGLPADGRQELIWDVVVDDRGVVWVALWNGGIGKSADNGRTWEIIVPRDRTGKGCTHFLSLAKDGDVIWAAAELNDSNVNDVKSGVFKSEDNGRTWTYYGQEQGLLNFCVVVNIQRIPSGRRIWVGTASPFGRGAGDGNGVFMSEDGGATWVNFREEHGLPSLTSYGFASAGERAWAGTDGGVARTYDGGATWETATPEHGLPSFTVDVVGAASREVVWAGVVGGVSISEDGGVRWRKVQTTPPAGYADQPAAFAFPNPFRPNYGRDQFLIIRYGLVGGGVVTLDIYDFAGRRVKRLVDRQYRAAGDRIDEYWDGLTEEGRDAANGVYFFTLSVDGELKATGKFALIQ